MQTRIFDTAADFKRFVGARVFTVTHRRKSNGRWNRVESAQINVPTDPATGRAKVHRTMSDDASGFSNDIGLVRYWNVGEAKWGRFHLDSLRRLEIDGDVYTFEVK